MVTVFDAANKGLDPSVFLMPVLLVLAAIIILMRARTPGWRFGGGGVVLLLGIVTLILPIADRQHVRAVLTDGSSRTVEGTIRQHKRETVRRWSGRSTGVGITSTNRYTSTTSEQFFVGPQWFWLRVNGFPSGTSFTNGGNPPLALQNGMRVRVTWFADPWFDDETRILKFEIEENAAGKASAGPAVAAALPDDFASFWQRFSKAAARGERDDVKTLTRFPFLFSGTPLDADRFDNIWAGIFPEPLRPCFENNRPVADGAAWSASCGVYVYVFEKGPEGWRLAAFTADPEAAE